MVEGLGIDLYSNTPPHVNALWAWSVDAAKAHPTLRNKSIWELLRFELETCSSQDSWYYAQEPSKLMVEGPIIGLYSNKS